MNNWYCTIMSGDFEGEEFFVQCNARETAIMIAKNVAFGADVSVGRTPWTDEEAERLGLDTY